MTRATLQEWEGRPVAEWQREWRIPRLTCLAVTTSTNDVARTHALAGAIAGTVVIAEAQSHGRGRSGRDWVAPPGRALLLSVVLTLDAADPAGADAGTAPIRVGMATASAIRQASGLDARVKWPNDIVIGGDGKVAGILCEAMTSRTGAFVIAGIGINVDQSADDFGPDLRATATSLRLARGRVVRSVLAGALLERLRPFRLPGGPLDDAALSAWSALDALSGTAVLVDGEPAGIASGIAPDGSLILRNGPDRRHVRTGTVRPVAPDLTMRTP
ncbi:MAG: biotin--[acetyl-CoA-carboxylase] ligase [Gemmatimonadetes bacterium]|nr:biotin--[acetyl-CoA-carboxylase] ligase [Gemmatimonadota bacterium]